MDDAVPFGEAVHRGEFVVRRGEAHLQARDLAEPALLLGLVDTGMKVGDDLAQLGGLRGVRP
ncbi:hypothetical protein ACFZDK_50325 [Streptomyces sp. NPDC007901]|uniref:hypothetical protein n=1 Tax=Streptomyces sp. NPDC007901 TaxID=3364785 RepID=UPI0036E41220